MLFIEVLPTLQQTLQFPSSRQQSAAMFGKKLEGLQTNYAPKT
jgi:hypothetical protein